MGYDLSSSWSSPRGWKLISLTLLGLTLLLLVPLYQLSDHDTSGIYSHLTKYLGNTGDAGNNPSGTTLLYNAEPTNIITESDIKSHKGVDDTDLDESNESDASDVDAEEDSLDNTVESIYTTSFTETKPSEESKPDEETIPENTESNSEYEHLPEGDNTKSPQPTAETDPETGDNSSDENQMKPDDGNHSEDENRTEEQNNETTEENNETTEENNETTEENNETPDETIHGLSVYPESRTSPCDGFPSMDGIMLVMKTGATEAFTKLPTQLLTGLQCIDDFLIFSDLEQQVGKYRVYNVLDNVKPEAKGDLMEFSLYDEQTSCPTSQQDCTRDMKGGWELDKYKFLHMIERAWTMRPDMEWYVFAEADSYVFWPNLVWWLRNKLNPRDFPYVGSVAMLKSFPFAHGGSGYVLSGQTVKAMAETPGLAHKYDLMAPQVCCGDYLMALAVNDTGSKVKQAHPMFNGEKPSTLPYSNSHWCQALMTMHHMNSEEVSQVWDYEQKRTSTGFVQIKDMYEAFFAPHLVPRRDDWDNLSDDVCFIGADEAAQNAAGDREKSRQKPENEKSPVELQAHFSAEHCSRVSAADRLDISQEEYDRMENDSERSSLIQFKYDERSKDENWNRDRQYFQWRYRKNVCCVQKSFKLGQRKKESNVDDRWTSGWFVDGINNWIAAKGQCETEWRDMN